MSQPGNDIKDVKSAAESDAQRLERIKGNKWMKDISVLETWVKNRRAVIDAIGRTIVKAPEPEKTTFKVMTFNILALGYTSPEYYKGSDSAFLMDQKARLATVTETIASQKPDVVCLQEVEQHALDFLVAAFGGSYIATLLAADANTFPPGTSLNPVGCAILVHNRHAGTFASTTKRLDDRGFVYVDFKNANDDVFRIASVHLKWRVEEERAKVYAVMKQVADEFKTVTSGCFGTDSNLMPDAFRVGISKHAPKFSFDEKAYPSASYLHVDDLKKCGAMDFLPHFGLLGTKISQPFPVETPTKKEELSAAFDVYAKRVGSDHLPAVLEFPFVRS